jgi:fusion and transport protein UGO1
MNTQSYIDGSLRPYVSRSDFDLHYPIAYQQDIGIIDTATSQSISQSLPLVQSQIGGSSNTSGGGLRNSLVGIHGFGARTKASANAPFLSTDLSSSYDHKSVSDLEWNEFFDISNLKEILIALTRRFIQGWMKCLISQPFDVVRILLQVGSFKSNNNNNNKIVNLKPESNEQFSNAKTFDEEEISSDSEIEGRDAYFINDASSNNLRSSQIERRLSRKSSGSLKNMKINLENGKKPSILIEPASLNTFDMLNSLLAKEGPRGILKAVNTTFLMHTLQYTIESWVSGFISGIIGIPDPLFVDMIHSPNPNWSLLLKMFSNVFSCLVLTQLRLIRAKFIVTTSTRGCRSFREIIWNIPRFYIFSIPKSLLIPSIITNSIKSFTLYFPEYFLLSMKINKYNNPYVYNMSSVILKIFGLFIRLPFETLYARAQVNYLLTNKTELPKIMRIEKDDMCVAFGGYYGYLSTLYYIIMGSKPLTYEGQSLEVDVDETEENKGIQAIFRGWKVGLLRLVSSYTLNLLRDDRYNVQEERF